MPSEHQSADGHQRERFPQLQEDIGEDPARFLDRDLLDHRVTKLTEKQSYGPRESPYTLRPDGDVSAPGEMVKARIRGIDSIAVARAWLAVERRLERGPREKIVQLIEQRIAHLEEHGERQLPDWTTEERFERAAACYEAVAPKDDAVWTDRENGERSTTYNRSLGNALATGGGDER